MCRTPIDLIALAKDLLRSCQLSKPKMVMIGIKGQRMLSAEILYISVHRMKIFLSSCQEINFTGWIFPKMVDEHLQRGAEITVAAKPVPTNEASGLGLLRVNEEFGIVDFVEKPTDREVISRLVPPELKGNGESPDRCLASMGIYVFNASAMFDALEGNTRDFGKEVIPSLVGKKDLRCHVYDDYWEDIGTVRSFFEGKSSIMRRISKV